jgi:hypothetical protein
MNFKVIDNILHISYVYNNIEYNNEYDIRILDKNIINNLTIILNCDYDIQQNNNTINIIYNYKNSLTERNVVVNFVLYNSTLGKNEALLLRKEYREEINKLQESFKNIETQTNIYRDDFYNYVLNNKKEEIHPKQDINNSTRNEINDVNIHNINLLIKHTNIIKSKISKLFWHIKCKEREHYEYYPNYPGNFTSYK